MMNPWCRGRMGLGWLAAICIAVLLAVSVLLFGSRPEHLLQQARDLRAGQPRQALALVESYLRQKPGDCAAQLLRCQILVSMGRFETAMNSFQQIKNFASCPPDELIRLGVMSHTNGNDALAEAAFDTVADSVHDDVAAMKAFIEVKYALNRTVETLDLCHDYARMAPGDPFPWLVCASIHHEREDRNPAIEAYQQALLCHPSRPEVVRIRYQLVSLLMDVGDLQKARQQCDLLIAQATDANVVATELQNGELLRREDKASEAMTIVNKVLAQDPSNIRARQLRGILQFDSGHFMSAIEDLTEVVNRESFNQPAHYKLGQAYLRQGQLDQADIHLRRSEELIQLTAEILTTENRVRNNPSDRQLILKLGELYDRRGNPQMAARWRARLPGDDR